MTVKDEDILEDGETVNLGADSDLELEIVNDEPEASPEPEGDEEELASYSKNVKKRIAQLTFKAREAERERERLERQQAALADYTKRTMAENQALKKALNNGQSLMADQLKGRVTSDLALAEKKLKEAMELGDYDKQVAASKEIAKLAVEQSRAEAFKPVRVEETAPELPEIEPRQPTPSPRAADWHRKNRWFGQDQTMTAYARHVHDRLVVFDHIDPNSDSYWSKLDQEMQKRFPQVLGGEDDDGDYEEEEAAPAPRRSNVVAPVKRSGSAPRKVQLTATEVAIAKRLGLTLEQYAKEKLKGF
jgi:hypothetical protein